MRIQYFIIIIAILLCVLFKNTLSDNNSYGNYHNGENINLRNLFIAPNKCPPGTKWANNNCRVIIQN